MPPLRAMPKLGRMPCLANNEVKLLINGQATFDAIFAAIAEARQAVLVQFFIIHDDDIGKKLQQLLLRKAAEGVQVFVLYDRVGSHALPASYSQTLREGGVKIHALPHAVGGSTASVNFRNHRKIVVVDGLLGFLGGHNVGTSTSAATLACRLGVIPTFRSAAQCLPACRSPSPKTGIGPLASCRR